MAAQTLDDLDAIAAQLAERAHEQYRAGFRYEATYSVYLSLALFGAIEELKRRRRQRGGR